LSTFFFFEYLSIRGEDSDGCPKNQSYSRYNSGAWGKIKWNPLGEKGNTTKLPGRIAMEAIDEMKWKRKEAEDMAIWGEDVSKLKWWVCEIQRSVGSATPQTPRWMDANAMRLLWLLMLKKHGRIIFCACEVWWSFFFFNEKYIIFIFNLCSVVFVFLI